MRNFPMALFFSLGLMILIAAVVILLHAAYMAVTHNPMLSIYIVGGILLWFALGWVIWYFNWL